MVSFSSFSSPSAALGFAAGAVISAAAILGTAPATAKAPPSLAPSVVALKKACQKHPASKAASISILAEGNEAFMGVLTMKAKGKVPEHRDATEEYIHVLEGGGRITIDGKLHTIGAGDTVFMPANTKVSYVNGDQPLRALQVFAGPGPAKKYDGWTKGSTCP